MPVSKEVADRIVVLRTEGKTQAQIGAVVGLSQPEVSLILRDRNLGGYRDVPAHQGDEGPLSSVHLVARNPNEMALAKTGLELWLRGKVQSCDVEHEELRTAASEAAEHGWKTDTLTRHEGLAKKRGDFYRKVLAAVGAGYTIVPNFPIDVFAVRVKRPRPPREISTSTRSQRNATQAANEIKAPGIPQDEGRYVGAMPMGTVGSYPTKDSSGKEIEKYFFETNDYTEIEFPIEAARPEVMTATAEAMALRVFDEIGICPQSRKGDPLIIGTVLSPKVGYSQKRVSFLIAWHLDLRTL